MFTSQLKVGDSYQKMMAARRKIKQIDTVLKMTRKEEKDPEKVIELHNEKILLLKKELQRIEKKQKMKKDELERIAKEKEKEALKAKEGEAMDNYFKTVGKTAAAAISGDVKLTPQEMFSLFESTKAEYDRLIDDERTTPTELLIQTDLMLQVLALTNQTCPFNIPRKDGSKVSGRGGGRFSPCCSSNEANYDCGSSEGSFNTSEEEYVPGSLDGSYSDIDMTGFVIV